MKIEVHINESLSFSGIVLKLENNHSYMLMDGEGNIKGVSRNFMKLLNDNSKGELELKILEMCNITALFPSLLERVKKFN